jgi:GTP-binding protein EngB required for normal cell division
MADIRRTTQNVKIEEIWKNIDYTDSEYNPYRFIHCKERNIVLIGRSRTGKSTVAKVMGDIFHFSVEKTLYSETKQIDFHKITTNARNDGRYFFNIIDVPGFFDMSTDTKTSLTNEQIRNFINDCIRKNVCDIHMFAFVFSLNAGINEQDIKAMIYTKENFRDLASNMTLIITNCERYSEQERETLRENFFAHPTVMKYHLKEFFKQGVYFMGCLRHESRDQANTQSIQDEYKYVLEMRTRWIQKCIQSDNPFNIHHREKPCYIS